MLTGADARDAVIRGLQSADASTCRHCARALDHLANGSSVPALVAVLDDNDPIVRVEATTLSHAIVCEDDGCRPTAVAVLPKAVDVLADDEDAHVRAYELVGRFVHAHPAAKRAIDEAARSDASPAVRKKARWYAPGGTIYTTTKLRPNRPGPAD